MKVLIHTIEILKRFTIQEYKKTFLIGILLLFAYKSPEISVNNFVLDYRYKKSVETCRAHRKSGIAKHHEENELRNKYPTLSYIPRGVQHGAVLVGYTNRMSVALSSTPLLEIGDFDFRVKARNAFLTQGFLPSDVAKLVNKIQNQH